MIHGVVPVLRRDDGATVAVGNQKPAILDIRGLTRLSDSTA